jgi:hypothetical protein
MGCDKEERISLVIISNSYMKDKDIGPGGYKCSCCGPLPKDRPQFRRTKRRRQKQALKKELDQII